MFLLLCIPEAEVTELLNMMGFVFVYRSSLMPVSIKVPLERGITGNRWSSSYCFSLPPDRILKESSKVFEDVLESFYSIDCIKSQFEAWRSKYFASYKDAYIGLCLPKLFNPLIRLQLLIWTPLEVRSSASNFYPYNCSFTLLQSKVNYTFDVCFS